MSRRVERECVLSLDADAAWQLVLKPSTFRWVAAPLLRVSGELPTRWRPGEQHILDLWLFGVLPTGRHRLLIESVDSTHRVLQTDERSRLLKVWRHRIGVEPVSPDRCRYRDQIDVDAGRLTGVVTLGASAFFAWRQRRLRRLAALRRAALGPDRRPA